VGLTLKIVTSAIAPQTVMRDPVANTRVGTLIVATIYLQLIQN